MSQKTKRILIPILASLVVAAGGVAITAQFPEITGTVAEAASVRVEDSDTSKEEDFSFGQVLNYGEVESYYIYAYNGTASNVIIPSSYKGKSITSIRTGTFRNNKNITNVTIPNSIVEIDGEAFSGCTGLTDITIPEGVKTIEYGVFSGCTGLVSITIPESVESMGSDVFKDCPKLTSVTLPQYSKLGYWSNPFRDMPGDVFENASILYYENGNGTVRIGGAIGRVKDGETLVIPKYINGKKVVRVSGGGFKYCAGLKKVELADGFQAVGTSMFAYCKELEEVRLPNSITSVKENAFRGCSTLQSITLPEGVKYIDSAAFYRCSSLQSITLPKGLEKIDRNVFRECASLESVTLPEGLQEIGRSAFYNCSSLKEVFLPPSITNISNSAFRNCNSLQKITFSSPNKDTTSYSKLNVKYFTRKLPSNVQTNGCLRYREDMTDGTPSITIIDYVGSDKTVTIPDSIDGKPVTRIKSYAFHGNEYVEEIIVPDSVTEIQGDAFKNCAKLKTVKLPKNLKGLYHCTFKNCPSLTDVTIPEGVTFIGTNAFQDCTALQKIEIPASVKKLKDGAFQGCTRLSEVTLHNGLLYLSFDAFNGCTDLQQITLPNSLKMIKSRAFKNSGLQTITLPNSVTTMGEEVFMGCTGLTEASLSNKLSYTNYYTFSGCTNLEKVTLPAGIKTIGYGTFSACSSLKTIALPSTLEGIDEGAFNDCTSLQAITVPDSVKYIGGRAFQNCVGLQKATLSQSLIAIPWSAFENCVNLQSVNIPKKVTTINAEAFKNCTSLQSVTIPDRVNTIYQEAFSGCRSLSTVTVPKYVTSIGENIFANCPNTTIKGYKNSYASAYFEGDSRFVLLDDGSGGNTGGGGAIGGAGGAGAVTPPKEDTTISVKNCTVSTIGDQILVAGSVEPEVTVSDGNKLLEDGVDYMVYYRKNNKIGEANAVIVGLGNYSGTKTVKFTVLPNNIDWKKCSTSTSAVRLNWEKVFGAEGYKIYRWNTRTNQWDSIADVKKLTSYRDGSRTAGCTYQYAVTAYATANGKTYESTLQTITTATRPKKAAIRKITANSKKKVTLTWKKIDGATGYQIYRSTEKNGTYTRVKTLSENTLKYTDKNLKSGKTYYYKIRAYRTVEDTRFYGAFSTARAITVK